MRELGQEFILAVAGVEKPACLPAQGRGRCIALDKFSSLPRHDIEQENGRKFLCKGLTKIFDDFEAHRKIVAFATPDTKNIEAIVRRTMPVLPELTAQPASDAKPTAIIVPVLAVWAASVLVVPKKAKPEE